MSVEGSELLAVLLCASRGSPGHGGAHTDFFDCCLGAWVEEID